ncbi:unnamed protein product [Rhizophagus irregularis]|nr:unnamed protein product [Rhizophagus irregularis]
MGTQNELSYKKRLTDLNDQQSWFFYFIKTKCSTKNRKLENKFIKGLDCDEDTIYLYTDASKRENKNSIGLVKMNASNKVLDKEYLRISNNFDVMELELMAIFIGFTSEAKVKIYTDNMTVYKIWKQLFNREELRIDVVYKDNLEYSIYSFVEIGNDMADALSKMSLENNDIQKYLLV